MSEDRLGPMRINQLGGGGVNGDMAPSPGGNGGDQFNIPGIGNIERGPTAFHTEHSGNKAMYNKLQEAARRLDHVRVELDKLANMGDTVSPEDVIAAAGKVVAHGVPAREIAAILADMPTQAGQGLAAWVMQSDTALTQQEMHVAQMRDIAQHRMGASALRQLAAEHLLRSGRERAAQAGALALRGRGAAGPAPVQRSALPQPNIIQMQPRPQDVPEGPGEEEAV